MLLKNSIDNRMLIFLHYNKEDNVVDTYVIHWLGILRSIYSNIIFVSNSDLDKENQNLIKTFCNQLLIRKNEGFDFGGWKDAILAVGWNELIKYDSLTLLNDTCFGPIFDLKNYYISMENKAVDFWGNTNHRSTYSDVLGNIPEHIQSYFIVFNKPIVQSSVFQQFWENVKYETNVLDVIRNYEVQLTSHLVAAGFKYQVWIDTTTEEYLNFHPNLPHVHPHTMLARRSPFIKVKNCIEHMNEWVSVEKAIISHSDYPIHLIHSYLGKLVIKSKKYKDTLRSIYWSLPDYFRKTALIKNTKKLYRFLTH